MPDVRSKLRATSRRSSEMNCPRCGTPLGQGVRWCPRCGATLPEVSWAAKPPPHSRIPGTRVAPAEPPGPTPRYGPVPPRWGFRPVAYLRPSAVPPASPDPTPWLRATILSATATAVVLIGAAGAELWQYLLLAAGRTRVLDARPVRIDRALVVSLGWTGLVLSLVTAALLVITVLLLQAGLSRRLRVRVRDRWSVLLRFVVPLWNLYGLPQVLIETDRLVTRLDPDVENRTRVPPRLLVWSGCWWVGAAVSVAAMVRRLGTTAQAVADTVLLHAAAAAVGAVLAVTTVVVLRGYRSATAVSRRWEQWRVATPAPTRPVAHPPTAAAEPVEVDGVDEDQQERTETPGTEADVATLATTSASAAGSQAADGPPTTVTRT